MSSVLSLSPIARFDAVDDADLQQSFTAPGSRPDTRRVFVSIDGMHCAACAVTIEAALGALPGVAGADVSVAAGSAVVEWRSDAGMPLSRVFGAIEAAGPYRACPADDHGLHDKRRRERRRELFRLGIAGLCMMQVMMYAWPAYIAPEGDLAPDIARLLQWASLMMSVPVLIFSARPFYTRAWADLRARRVGMDLPVALGVLIAFFGSTWSMFQGSGEVWFDSLTMFVFFLLGGRWLESSARRRATADLDRLTRRLPEAVERLAGWPADTAAERVAVGRIRAGDVVRVAVGEAFPGDGRVLRGVSAADESVLTGESLPCSKRDGDEVVAGSFNLEAPLVVRIERAGAESRYGQVLALMSRAATEKPRLARIADAWAGWFLTGVLVLAAAAGLGWWLAGSSQWLQVVVSVLVVTCPCALSLAQPMASVTALGRLARQGVLVAHPAALEALAGATHAVLDKTGTVTCGVPALRDIQPLRDLDADASLALAAALDAGSRHPLARSLVAAAETRGLTTPADVTVTAERAGHGIEGCWQGRRWTLGAVPTTLPRSATVEGADRSRHDGAAQAPSTDRTKDDPADMHGPAVLLSDDHGPVARFLFDDALREDAPAALAALRDDGLSCELLSGDRPGAVAAAARRLGLDAWRARALPADKLARVEAMQREGARVLAVGDGINDAPLLSRADVSVAMGQGAPIAQSGADLVLLSDRLGDIALARAVARRMLRVTRQNLAWSASYNFLCVPLALAGWLPPWAAGLGMAASSLVVVMNAARLSR